MTSSLRHLPGKGKAHKPGPHPEPVALTGAEVTHPVICMTHAEEPEDGRTPKNRKTARVAGSVTIGR